MDLISRGLLLGLFLVLSVLPARAQEPILLDFGSADSPLYEGFARATAAGGERATWRTRVELREVVREIGRGPMTDSNGTKLPRPNVYFTELSCDYVTGDGPAELDIAVPAGKYKAWVLFGNPGGSREKVWNTRISTESASKTANIPGDIGMRYLLLDGVAGEKGLTLRFDTANSWLLSAVVVVPEADWERVGKELVAPLWHEYAFLPKDVAKQWKNEPIPLPFTYPEPRWSERQTREGFAVFSRSACAPVWPEAFPAAREIEAPVRSFAAWDQYETLSFTIHALRDFKTVSVRSGDLVSREGIRIPGNLRVDYVRNMILKPFYMAFGSWYEGPDLAMPWEDQPLAKGRNLRVWLTAYVPPYTPAGDYRGTAEIDLDGRTRSVPLTLKVLPITLQKDRGRFLSFYYFQPYRRAEAATDDFSRQWWRTKAEKEYAEMARIGMNGHPQLHLYGTWRKDRWVYDFDKLDRFLDFGRRYGFDRPFVCGFPMRFLYRKHMDGVGYGEHLSVIKMPPDAFFAELTEMVREILREATARNWPEPILYPFDEPNTHPAAVEFVARCLKAMKAGGARIYMTTEAEDPKTAPWVPYIDVWNSHRFGFDPEEAVKARPGTQYWCYPSISISASAYYVTPQGVRMTYGYGVWRSGYRGLMPWHYQDDFADPWNYLDGYSSDFGNRNADDASVIPMTNWIGMRAGIDDGRYLYTLERWIETAERYGYAEAAAAARADLAEIRGNVEREAADTNDALDASSMDTYRWKLAQRILELRELVAKESVPDA